MEASEPIKMENGRRGLDNLRITWNLEVVSSKSDQGLHANKRERIVGYLSKITFTKVPLKS